jgi:hypothetical protein
VPDFDINEIIDNPETLAKVKEMIADIDSKLTESQINYRFVIQMIGGDGVRLPTEDVLTVFIAKTYADKMRQWDGSDMYLPMLFARLTVKEVMGK